MDNSQEYGIFPLAYLITFSCYGTHLHGHESGSVNTFQNLPGTDFMDPSEKRVQANRETMLGQPYELDEPRREIVLDAIKEVCDHREWRLIVAHVRTNHIHFVVQGNAKPEKIMNDVKAYASRRLKEKGFDKVKKRWTKHGSTRYLWKDEDLENAFHYVLLEQGEPMALYDNTVI